MTRRTFFGSLLTLPVALAATPAAAMTKAQMQAVAVAITNAGFEAHEMPNGDGTWKVRGRAPDFVIDASTVANLATAQGVTAKVAEAEFS